LAGVSAAGLSGGGCSRARTPAEASDIATTIAVNTGFRKLMSPLIIHFNISTVAKIAARVPKPGSDRGFGTNRLSVSRRSVCSGSIAA
jgi:hypothetical protein